MLQNTELFRKDDKMKNELILDYIRAAVNLYGVAPLNKVVEIYNMHNGDEIIAQDLDGFKKVEKEYFTYHRGCFVHEAILMYDEFDFMTMKQKDKPYYMPPKEEFMKYADDFYFERTKEYEKLKIFIKKNISKDEEMAEEICEDIQLSCTIDFSLGSVIGEFERRNIVFESEAQVKELATLIINLANSTRLWENNGYTPEEINRINGSGSAASVRKHKKIGRNDPCPCGSGKKYKKCCGM